MRHVILISGKDSLAAALVQTTRHPSLKYEYVFNDVAAELPETYEWMNRVEKVTGWKITRIGKNLLEMIAATGGFLPSPMARYCTRACKIEPTEEYIGQDECTVYYGLRADENREGYVPFRKPNLIPAYPLRDAGVDLKGVFSIIDAQNLMPPDFFWQRLYDAVSKKMVPWPGWEGMLSRIERRILFGGRTRSNCLMCFFQKQAEFLWLYETHPDLFRQAEALEKPGEYSFQPGFFLADLHLKEKREKVFKRRVKEVCKTIIKKFQGDLFGEPGDNELALTSCGLLCGK